MKLKINGFDVETTVEDALELFLELFSRRSPMVVVTTNESAPAPVITTSATISEEEQQQPPTASVSYSSSASAPSPSKKKKKNESKPLPACLQDEKNAVLIQAVARNLIAYENGLWTGDENSKHLRAIVEPKLNAYLLLHKVEIREALKYVGDSPILVKKLSRSVMATIYVIYARENRLKAKQFFAPNNQLYEKTVNFLSILYGNATFFSPSSAYNQSKVRGFVKGEWNRFVFAETPKAADAGTLFTSGAAGR